MRRLNYFLYSLVAALIVIMLSGNYGLSQTSSITADKFFPADSGMINVQMAYGAKGDGVTDDTQAILNAIRANVGNSTTIYFPSGTYLVSDRLEWRNADGTWAGFLAFQGQNQSNTIIKLQNAAPGFTDATNPRAVIYTASVGGGNNTGEGNQAYKNNIQDLTIDTGTGNPGAIGIDYLASNKGTIRNVTIRSDDGQGKIGLGFIRQIPGPCLIKNVTISGFDYGIDSNQTWTGSITFEHITLKNQNVAGIQNEGTPLAIRGLTSTNSVPAINSTTWLAFTTLIDANLIGGSASVSAIQNPGNGKLYARNLTTSGYQSAINNQQTMVPGASYTEYAYPRFDSLFPSPQRSLNLPIAETPTYHDNDFSNWANVVTYGAQPNSEHDDSDAIQQAIDSGKSTIYFPTGVYHFTKPIIVRGNVRKMLGLESTFLMQSGHTFTDTNNPKPIFTVKKTNYDTVIMEGFNIWPDGAEVPNAYIGIKHASPKQLVLQSFYMAGTFKYAYSNTSGVGPLFAEDVAVIGDRQVVTTTAWQFQYPQTVWARQMDTEYRSPGLFNNGGKLWILGLKGEGNSTNVYTKGSGQTEVLGGVVWGGGQNTPAFIIDESQVSLSIYLEAANPDLIYPVLVKEKRNRVTKLFNKSDAIPVYGSVLPLYVGFGGS